jgi:hypothetical protein
MPEGLPLIKQGIAQLRAGLESTVHATAKEVRGLGTTCSEDYAEAILDENGYGGDTAEIYFYRFAPEGFPSPSDRVEFQALMGNPQRSAEYRASCYKGWRDELQSVQEVVARHDGAIEVEGMTLQDYLGAVQEAGETPDHRVHVRVSVPGQDQLRLIRNLEKSIGNYEAPQTE